LGSFKQFKITQVNSNPFFLNAAAYRFVPLLDLANLQIGIRTKALQAGLTGTVLLASEGINLFIAGSKPQVNAFLDWLRQDPRFKDLKAKESSSVAPPFGKLQVKIKPEIIRMNMQTIAPANQRAPGVEPQTLARWLDQGCDDQGQPVVTLDTRNAFEVAQGKFKGALDWQLQKFSQFPQAAEQHVQDLKGKTVVSYCTGGIRCEKAALLLQQMGIKNALQLEGGILNYFEQTDGRHFDGDCFVFDNRIAVRSDLSPI
jgi:UPF0176 protein